MKKMDNRVLTDEEIRELFKNSGQDNPSSQFSKEEIDALGEIGNISIGTSATTLYSLLRNKVIITTPNVSITSIKQLKSIYPLPFIAVEVTYTKGIEGSSVMIIKEDDAKIIADLMMGGDGTNVDIELDELRMSAVAEAMNQMMGSAATSLSTILKKDINISPPNLYKVNFATDSFDGYFKEDQLIVNVAFKMEVGNLIKSEIMQLMPIDFAKSLVEELYNITMTPDKPSATALEVEKNEVKQISDPAKERTNEIIEKTSKVTKQTVVANPVQFETFDDEEITADSASMELIMDVPLDVTVELGSTQKPIKEILKLGPGSIIELDKMAGEPADILVNGKLIARGEVVVIDENFGVRVTEIIHSFRKSTFQN